VAALNYLVTPTGAGIVVSSALRSTVDGARCLLDGWGVEGTVLGITPRRGRGRAAEIEAWLDANLVRAYVVLDDVANLGTLAPQYMRVDERSGLRMMST
jgi:hypothetical protein